MVNFAEISDSIKGQILKGKEALAEKVGCLEGRKIAHLDDALCLLIGITAIAILLSIGLLAAGITLTTIGAMTGNPLMLGFGITFLILFGPVGFSIKR